MSQPSWKGSGAMRKAVPGKKGNTKAMSTGNTAQPEAPKAAVKQSGAQCRGVEWLVQDHSLAAQQYSAWNWGTGDREAVRTNNRATNPPAPGNQRRVNDVNTFRLCSHSPARRSQGRGDTFAISKQVPTKLASCREETRPTTTHLQHVLA